jgi:hypothetical protein
MQFFNLIAVVHINFAFYEVNFSFAKIFNKKESKKVVCFSETIYTHIS